MRQLLNPQLTIQYLNAGMKILVFTAATGETIGAEADEETEAKWVALITAPRPSSEPLPSDTARD